MKPLRTVIPLVEAPQKKSLEIIDTLKQYVQTGNDFSDKGIHNYLIKQGFSDIGIGRVRYFLSRHIQLPVKRSNKLDVDKAFELRKQGLTDSQIAAQMNIKTGWNMTRTLDNHHRDHPNYHPRNQKHGGARPRHSQKKIDLEHAFSYRKQGLHDSEIADKLGISALHLSITLDKHRGHPSFHPKNYKPMGRPRHYD